MPRVVLNALAAADLPQHFQVVTRTLLDALGLQQLAAVLEPLDPFDQFLVDGRQRMLHLFRRGHIMRRWVDGDMIADTEDLPGHRIHFLDALDLITEQLHPDRRLCAGRIDVDHIAAHAEGPSLKRQIVADILDIHQLAQDLLTRFLHTRPQRKHLVLVVERAAQAVNAGHRGHDNDIPALRQRRRRRVAQLFDLIVDVRIFFDIGIGRRYIGLRLIIVVVADKILHRVLREELLKLAVKLRRQRLIMGNHQRRLLHLLD